MSESEDWSESEGDGSGRVPMCRMAAVYDMEGITRLLDEGVDPASDEERELVRLVIGRCIGWTGRRVYVCLMHCRTGE